MSLPNQFASYNGRREELKRWFKSLYRCPMGEIVDLDIDNLRKECGSNDKKVGDVVIRKLNLEIDINEDSIRHVENSGPIGQKWMFCTISEYLKETTWIVMGRVMEKIQNMDSVALKELGKLAGNPAGLWDGC